MDMDARLWTEPSKMTTPIERAKAPPAPEYADFKIDDTIMLTDGTSCWVAGVDKEGRLWCMAFETGVEEEALPLNPALPPAAGDIVTSDDGSKCRMVKANGSMSCVPMVGTED